MTPLQYTMGAVFGLSLACGQMLFKLAANQIGPDGNALPMIRVLFTWPMIAACTLYALTIILYTYMLQQMPLSRAYMFSMVGSALVPFLAILIFKEGVSARYVVGAALVFLGVVLSTSV